MQQSVFSLHVCAQVQFDVFIPHHTVSIEPIDVEEHSLSSSPPFPAPPYVAPT